MLIRNYGSSSKKFSKIAVTETLSKLLPPKMIFWNTPWWNNCFHWKILQQSQENIYNRFLSLVYNIKPTTFPLKGLHRDFYLQKLFYRTPLNDCYCTKKTNNWNGNNLNSDQSQCFRNISQYFNCCKTFVLKSFET